MRVEIHTPESAMEPRFRVEHQLVLAMALRPGSIEIGLRRSKTKRFTYSTGEMRLNPQHLEKWFRIDGLHIVTIGISDAAIMAAADETAGKVELRSIDNLADARVGALAAAVNAERFADFPSGRLFLDSIEQALAVAFVNDYDVHHRSLGVHRGGLGSARLRRVKEFVHGKMEDELRPWGSAALISRRCFGSQWERHRISLSCVLGSSALKKCCARPSRMCWMSL